MINFAVMMEQGNGCALFNATKDNVMLASLLGEGHVHIVVHSGDQRRGGQHHRGWQSRQIHQEGRLTHSKISDDYDI